MRVIRYEDVLERRCPSPGEHAEGFRVFKVKRTGSFRKDKLGLPDKYEYLAYGGVVWQVLDAWAPEDGIMSFTAMPTELLPREHRGGGSTSMRRRTPQKGGKGV